MHDDFASLFAFNRWANARMLDACRKLTPEQYTAEPMPGWSCVRFTVWHMAIVTDGWLRALAGNPDQSFPAEEELPTVEDAERFNTLVTLQRRSRIAGCASGSRRFGDMDCGGSTPLWIFG